MRGDKHPKKVALLEVRERTVAKLAECFARDELGLEDFEDRVKNAYSAGTPGELQRLVRDLSGEPADASVAALVRRAVLSQVDRDELHNGVVVEGASDHRGLAPGPASMTAILGSVERRGALALGTGSRALAVLGNLQIDLREAILTPGLTEVRVKAVLGNIDIAVPADIAVECHGTGILGSFESHVKRVSKKAEGKPRLRIIATAILGSIEVRARPPSHVEQLVKQLRAKTE